MYTLFDIEIGNKYYYYYAEMFKNILIDITSTNILYMTQNICGH